MKYPVLVLNADYKPFDIWSWQKAMKKLLGCHSVLPVANYDYIIRDGKGNEYDVPSIVVLKQYMSTHNRPAPYSKMNIYARDNCICQYCGCETHPGNRTIDHVIPRAHWNPKRYHFKLNSFENIVTCCKPCNLKKSNRTPQQANMHLKRQPKKISRAEAYHNKLSLLKNMPIQWRDYITVRQT